MPKNKIPTKRKHPKNEEKVDEDDDKAFEDYELINPEGEIDNDDSSDEEQGEIGGESSGEEEDDAVDEEEEEEDEDEDDGSEGTIESEDLEWESDEENEKKDEVKNGSNVEVLNTDEKKDEYESGDTSDEEDIRNTVGNIPMNWYDDYPHVGYDWSGKKILKPQQGDQLDYFLKKMEDPNFWKTVKDPQTGQDVVLADDDIRLIKRLESQKIPDESFDEYAPWVEWFSSEVMKMPLRKFPEHKRSFVPSRDEMKKVSKYVHSLKMGWMKTREAIQAKQKEAEEKGPQFYLLWQADDVAEEMRRIQHHIPAPKRPLPDHSESYNPPEEYLFNKAEMKKWNAEKKSLGNKKLHFVPQKYNSLREVPAYKRFIRERFMRCLDLYMCPRAIKMRLTIEPEDLVPQLPNPMDLQPFPTVMSVVYTGHTDMIRSISVDPSGQFLASTSDDCTLKMWEINTGRCLKTIDLGGIGRSVAWCPNQLLSLIAVAADRKLFIINTNLGDSLVNSKTDTLLSELPEEDKVMAERIKAAVQWEQVEKGDLFNSGARIIINHFKEIKQVSWHGRGDYFFTVMPEGENRSVLIHQLSKRRSQLPFSKPRGLVQAALFHPTKPHFFVATQRNVRIYDLVKQEMLKKLITSSKWISNMAIHPGGDNLLVSTYDRKVLWFDLDLSTKPYKTLALHTQAVRSVAFHKRYPLFASTSDDQSMIISHGMVYNDLLQNALIVPLKRFSSHKQVNDFSIFDVVFHPYQPWVFTSGADGTVRLYS